MRIVNKLDEQILTESVRDAVPNLTMRQIVRVNNVAIAYDLNPYEITDALQRALKLGAAVQIPVEEMEELFYQILRVHVDCSSHREP